MKALIIALSLMSAQAIAAPMFDFGNLSPKLSKFKMSPEKVVRPANAPVLQPVRLARVKANITKIIQEVDLNGSVSVRWEDVCKLEGDAPVYDTRGLNEYTIGPSGLECTSTRNNKAVRIDFSATLMLYHGKLFDDEPEVDSKYAGGAIWVTETANNKWISYDFWSTGSRDMNATSFIGNTGGSGSISCVEDANGNMTCSTVSSETFQVTFEITDK